MFNSDISEISPSSSFCMSQSIESEHVLQEGDVNKMRGGMKVGYIDRI